MRCARNPRRRRGSKARFREKRLASARKFAVGSFRVIVGGRGTRIRIGCPRGFWSRLRQRCRIGTRAQAVLYPLKKRKWRKRRRR